MSFYSNDKPLTSNYPQKVDKFLFTVLLYWRREPVNRRVMRNSHFAFPWCFKLRFYFVTVPSLLSASPLIFPAPSHFFGEQFVFFSSASIHLNQDLFLRYFYTMFNYKTFARILRFHQSNICIQTQSRRVWKWKFVTFLPGCCYKAFLCFGNIMISSCFQNSNNHKTAHRPWTYL